MGDTVRMYIEMDVTVAQGLALEAMFKYWNQLSSLGGSREVGFYVDGDGNFHPNITVRFSDDDMPKLTDKMRKDSVVRDEGGNRIYDYDPIAWSLHD